MKRALRIAPAFAVLGLTLLAEPHKDLNRFFAALHAVEASNRVGSIKGDKGKSLGPLQISKDYWIDSNVAGRYEDCVRLGYSKRVATAYYQRWAPKALEAGDWEHLARIHNGGPDGHLQKSTIKHWKKVQKEMSE